MTRCEESDKKDQRRAGWEGFGSDLWLCVNEGEEASADHHFIDKMLFPR